MKVDLLKDMHVFKLLLYALVVLVKGKKKNKKKNRIPLHSSTHSKVKTTPREVQIKNPD